MKVFEFQPERQGRPYSPPATSLEERGIGVPAYSVKGVHLAGEFPRTTKTDNYTAGDEMVILVDATSSTVTITLPPATTNSSKVYYIKKIDSSSHSVTIRGDAPDETIDGEVEIGLTLQYQYVMIICDGSDWYILGGAYVKIEDILKSQETLLDRLAKQLGAILRCLSSMSGLNINEED